MDQCSNIIADKALRVSFYSFKVYLKNRIVGTYKELCEIAKIAIIDLQMYQSLESVIHFSLHYHYVCLKCYYIIYGLDTILIFLHRVNNIT